MNRLVVTLMATLSFAPIAAAQSASNSSNSQGIGQANSNLVYAPRGAKSAASAIAPSYNPGFGSCRSGIPLGGAGGGFGFSFGIPLDDAKCDTREDARYIAQLTGDRAATKERLCDTKRIRDAFARAGRPCVGDTQRTTTRVIRTNTRSVGAPTRQVAVEITTGDPVLARWCAGQPANKRPARCGR